MTTPIEYTRKLIKKGDEGKKKKIFFDIFLYSYHCITNIYHHQYEFRILIFF